MGCWLMTFVSQALEFFNRTNSVMFWGPQAKTTRALSGQKTLGDADQFFPNLGFGKIRNIFQG